MGIFISRTIQAIVAGLIILLSSQWALAGGIPSWGSQNTIHQHRAQPPRSYQPKARVIPRTGFSNMRSGFQPGATPGHSSAGYRTWEELLDAVWTWGISKYPVRAAATVRNSPLAQGNVAAQTYAIIVGTCRAINTGRYGDAAKGLADFQDKLMIIDVKSMRTLDLMMAAFLANTSLLPSHQRQQAVRGMLNMALLVFDQIQYTGRSYTLPVMYVFRNRINAALESYSGDELGLWFYSYSSGTMQRVRFDRKHAQFKNGLVSMIAHPGRFGNGKCAILELPGQGFACAGVPRFGSGKHGSGDGGGGVAGMPIPSDGRLKCMIAAVMAEGMHGQMSCMIKKASSLRRGMPQNPTQQKPEIKGVIDGVCGGRTGDESNDGNSPSTPPPDHKKAANAGEKIVNFVTKITKIFSKKPASSNTPASSPKPKFSKKEMDDLKDFSGNKKKPGLKQWKNKDMPTNGGTGCGDATNAVTRASALFSCTGSAGGGRLGDSHLVSGIHGVGPRSMPQPDFPGGLNGAKMSGLMSCTAQGGTLVRTSMDDKRCQQSMCAPNQSCACNGGGGRSTSSGMRRQEQLNPLRSNRGVTDPLPNTGVGGAPHVGGIPGEDPLGGAGGGQ